jgi:hypothetical protein
MSKRWLEAVKLRKVTIHLDTGRSIEGCIAVASRDGVMLKAATLLGEPTLNEEDTKLDGETWIPRERIMFCQVSQ